MKRSSARTTIALFLIITGALITSCTDKAVEASRKAEDAFHRQCGKELASSVRATILAGQSVLVILPPPAADGRDPGASVLTGIEEILGKDYPLHPRRLGALSMDFNRSVMSSEGYSAAGVSAWEQETGGPAAIVSLMGLPPDFELNVKSAAPWYLFTFGSPEAYLPALRSGRVASLVHGQGSIPPPGNIRSRPCRHLSGGNYVIWSRQASH